MWRKIEDQEERLRRLTDDQQRILDILANQTKAAIRGVAGSGKTILALAKAQAIAREGARTLFPLLQTARSGIGCEMRFRNRLPTTWLLKNYHGITDELCKEAGVPLWEMGSTDTKEFWTEVASEALMRACDRLGDGAQVRRRLWSTRGRISHDLWWTSLDSIFRDPANKACYYVFYDPNQNLYVEHPSLPTELGQPYPLIEKLQETRSESPNTAPRWSATRNKYRHDAPMGDEPEIVQVRTLADAFREAGRRVRGLCMPNLGGLRMSQVAVLAPGYTSKEWPARFGTIPVAKDYEQWSQDEGVLMDSWHRFKGLEADAIVIIETPGKHDARERVNRYVARSRAKHLLTVFEVEEL